MKKRLLALAAAAALLLTLAACGGDAEAPEPSQEPSQEATATPTPEPQVDLNSYIGSYRHQEYDTQGLEVSMEGDNLRVMAYQPHIVFFDEVVAAQALQGNQLHFVAEDPVTQEHFNVTLTFDGAHIAMTSTSPQLGEEGTYIPGEASDLPLIEEPPEEELYQDDESALYSLTYHSGEYTYEDPAGDYYVLTLSDAESGSNVSLFWRGMYLYENAYASDESREDNADGSHTFSFQAADEIHRLVLWPSSDGGQQFYLDDIGPFTTEQ